jgi:hypothetical protein
MKKIIMTIFCTSLIFLLTGYEAHSEQRMDYGEPVCSYVGDDGISVISFSQEWSTVQKLKSVHDELLKNEHGEEIDYFSTIYIYPDSPDGVASYYHDDYYLGDDGVYHYSDGRYMEIFDGDEYTTLSEIARLISHEYGHHFFFYYYITNKNLTKDMWINSEYASIRGLDNIEAITYLGNVSNIYNHEWDIVEILADDYVQIYGSSLAKSTRDYLDVQERIDQDIYSYTYYYQDFNLLPQENLDLPLAADVVGLSDYFYELTNVMPKEEIEDLVVPVPQITEINSVYKSYNEYIFEWDAVKEDEEDGDYEYTLIINEVNDNDYPTPAKTVYSGEALTAVTGSCVDLNKRTAIIQNYEGDYEVRLFVKDQNGYMHSSSVVTLTVTPKDNSRIIFKDIYDGHWAENYIYDLTNKGIVEGYPGNTFRPEGNITIAEYMTFLIRTLNNVELTTAIYDMDWFEGLGYKSVAQSIGLLDEGQGYDYYSQNISRDEMARLIYIMLDLNEVNINVKSSSFIDVTDDNNVKEISVAKYYKIITGYSDNTYRPDNDATRAEAMKMISVYIEVVD